MILLLHYQNLSASNAAFVIIVEILHVLIKVIPSKMRANYQSFLGRIMDKLSFYLILVKIENIISPSSVAMCLFY
jgi:hypothetical protein